jgi:hypothetical protein
MVSQQALTGESVILGTCDDTTQYVLAGVVTNKLTQQTALNKLTLTANGIDSIIITGAPIGTFTATNINTNETVTGPISGTDTFTTTVPGTINIKIESWPYLDFNAVIVAS